MKPALLLITAGLSAGGFAVLFGYAILKPSDPYYVGYGPHQQRLRKRLAAAAWTGGVGFVASLMVAGSQVAAMLSD